jgi:serine/threonine-protein kinase
VNGGRWQVSVGGGTRPLWAPNGQELFYVSPVGALMRVSVGRGTSWSATAPALLIKPGYIQPQVGNTTNRQYDISPDGQRFLMVKTGGGSEQTAAPLLTVVQHFDEELKRLVPTN